MRRSAVKVADRCNLLWLLECDYQTLPSPVPLEELLATRRVWR